MQKVAIDVEVLDRLSAHTRELERLVGTILARKHDGRNPTADMLYELTDRTKGIIAGMYDVDHAVAVARNPQGPRSRRTGGDRYA